ncbi:MAG: hypothetical protein MUF79_08645 [Burkholderiales bacterium]|nr:hypothetical protein [Burkholderiales bacterium]
MKRALVLAALAAAAAAAFGWWHARGEAVTVMDAPSPHFACVSYAPYRKPGQTPFAKGAFIPPEQIDADLAMLADRVDCVRTYSVDQGLDAVPKLAGKHGLKVLLGVWIGRNAIENEREMAKAIALANAHRDVIAGVIVGNEVLLRREQPPEELARLARRFKVETGLPVTYADVWEFWLRNRPLADSVDFVTVHLLPYWEDDPQPIGRAIPHALAVLDEVAKAFPGKRIVIGEIGWPSAGRTREGAAPGRVNQARFMREFAAAAAARKLDYNVIEAFDQPWKRRLEGATGGYWGLLDVEGNEKFPFRGALEEDPGWKRGPLGGLAGAAAFLLVALARSPRPGVRGALLLALAGFACGATLAAQWDYAIEASRDGLEWAANGGMTLVAALAGLLGALALAAWSDGRGDPPAPVAIADLRRPRHAGEPSRTLAKWFGVLRFATLFGAALVTVLLVFDARYRDFPLPAYAIPVVAFALLAFARGSERAPRLGLEERVLAWIVALAAPVIAVKETVANHDALWWWALAWLLALPVLLPEFTRRAGGETREA